MFSFVELTTTLPPPLATASTTSSRIINNSFDIINPIVTDEGGEQKRKQPPLAFRSGTREVHNKLEKHRRAHLKECFDLLKRQLPVYANEKKASNLSILHSALCYIQALKRREIELEHEMEQLAREKIAHQQKLVVLKKEVQAQCDSIDITTLLDVSPATTIHQTTVHQQSQSPTFQQSQHHQQITLENNINCKLINDRLPKTTPLQNVTDLQKLTTRPSTTTQRTVVSMNGIKEVTLNIRKMFLLNFF